MFVLPALRTAFRAKTLLRALWSSVSRAHVRREHGSSRGEEPCRRDIIGFHGI